MSSPSTRHTQVHSVMVTASFYGNLDIVGAESKARHWVVSQYAWACSLWLMCRGGSFVECAFRPPHVCATMLPYHA